MRLLSATCFLVCFSGTLIAAKEVTLNDGLANALLDWALRDLTLTPLQNTDGDRKRSISSSPSHPQRRENAIRYNVPFTNTTLWIREGDSLGAAPMSGVIQATYGASQQLIKNIAGGDQWLPDWIEPMNMVPNNGAAITLTSRKKQHLTFGMVGSAMQGLYDYMFGVQRNFECTFEIWEDFSGNWAHVGDGVLQAHTP